MKKILALMLALVMVLGMLAGCNDDEGTPYVSTADSPPTTPADPVDPPVVFNEAVLLGVWDVTEPCPEGLFADLQEQYAFMEGITIRTPLNCIYEFKEDGTAVKMVHKDAISEIYDGFSEDFAQHLKDGAIYKLYEEQNISKEELDGMMESAGITIDELVEEVMALVSPVLDDYFSYILNNIETDADGYIVTTGAYTLEDDILTAIYEENESKAKCFYDGNRTVTLISEEDGAIFTMVKRVKSDTEE